MNGKTSIAWMLLCVLAAGLYGQAGIPQEVDPSSGKMSLEITLTTMTGRGFDLPIVFSYNSNLWNKDFTYGTTDPSTWVVNSSVYGLGWQCNAGGRLFCLNKTKNDTTTYNWMFATNEGSVHPVGKYPSYYFDGISDWYSTDNSWIKIAAYDNFDSLYGPGQNGVVRPTLANGTKYDSITEYFGNRDAVADDGISGYRFGHITDANGNRPFHFNHNWAQEGLIADINGLKDTVFFYYDASYQYMDSILVRSGTGAGNYRRLFRFYERRAAVTSPSLMGSITDSVFLLDSIKMNGELLYKFTYNSAGEISSVTNRTGGKKEYFYGTHPFWEVNDSNSSRTCYTRRVDSVRVTPRSNETYTWKYQAEIDSLYKNPHAVRVTTPSLGRVDYLLHSYDCRPSVCGCNTSQSRDGLIYKVANLEYTSTGSLAYVNMTENGWMTDQTSADGPRWNAHVDTSVTTWIGTGDSTYDLIETNTVTSEDVYNNPLEVSRLITGNANDYTEARKYVYEGSSYTSRNIIGLLKEGYTGYINSSNYVSKTVYKYDDAACSTYAGSFTGWVTPDSCRGNLTTIINYGASDTAFEALGPGGDSTVSRFRYDQFGNQIKSISYPSQADTEITFTRYTDTTANPYVFPVRTVNYVTSKVDSLVTSTLWNFHTGLPDSTQGYNGQWTSYTYDDFGRVLAVKLPGESSAGSKHRYHDTATTPYQIDSTRLDASRWLVSYTYTDGFGSPIQTQSVDNSNSKTFVTDFRSRTDSSFSMVSNTREVSGALSSYQTPTWSALKYSKTYFDFLGRDTLSVDQTGNKTCKKYGIDGAPWTLVWVQNDSVNYWQSWTKTIQNSRGLTEKIINSGKHASTEKADTTLFEYYYPYYPVPLVKKVTNPRGQITFYYYDRAMRLRGIDGPDVAADTFYTDREDSSHNVDVLLKYDDYGRVIEKTTPTGTIRNTYDEIGRLTHVHTRKTGTSAYGLSLEMVYDSTQNARGLLSSTRMPAVRCLEYDYDVLGRTTIKMTLLPFGSRWKTIKYAYNDAGLLTKLVYPGADSSASADTVKYQ